jgi:hypothetical protein
MAKQIGAIKIVGTIADITFYRLEGQYYARLKSSLTGKRVKKDPRFKRTMESAYRLGRGSQLASKVYRSLPKAEQVYALYKELKSIAVKALKEGHSEMKVVELLQERVQAIVPLPYPEVIQRRKAATNGHMPQVRKQPTLPMEYRSNGLYNNTRRLCRLHCFCRRCVPVERKQRNGIDDFKAMYQ